MQTLNGRAILTCVRLYGSEAAFYNQTWISNDAMKKGGHPSD